MIKSIKSVSGLRGIIENKFTDTLTKNEVSEVVISFINYLKSNNNAIKIVIGRDGRSSGEKILSWIIGILNKYDLELIDIGLTTTPTLGLAVKKLNANGGIMITASHNPQQWNGLKLFNSYGEGFSSLDLDFLYSNSSPINDSKNSSKLIYKQENNLDFIQHHINLILKLPLIDIKAIRSKKWKVAIDGTNSTGSIALELLLKNLGVETIKNINSEINGNFNRNPEPIPENLNDLISFLKHNNYNIGFATDPDADRLSIVDENGIPLGEEYTLVAVADYILSEKPGPTVSNLSSSKALKVVTENYQQQYFSAPVGEANVIKKMKEVNAVIGGEGNGGIIYPELQFCRDSLVGVALILSYLSKANLKASELNNKYPKYEMIKKKISLDQNVDIDKIISDLKLQFQDQKLNEEDGLRIDFDNSWLHIRKSNTEPIIRICAESENKAELIKLYNDIVENILKT